MAFVDEVASATDAVNKLAIALENGEGKYSLGMNVLSAEPWVWTITWNHRRRVCAACFTIPSNIRRTNGPDLRACEQCKTYAYCNTECQKVGWTSGHYMECELMRNMALHLQSKGLLAMDQDNSEMSYSTSMVYYVTSLVVKVLNRLQSDEGTSADQDHENRRVKEFYQDTKQPPSNLSPSECALIKELVQAAFNVPSVSDILPETELWRYYCRTRSNISQMVDKTSHLPYGIGLYFENSSVKRCCDNNVIQTFKGKTMVVKATKDLTKSSELRSPGLVQDLQPLPRKLRQRYYLAIYGKECDCRKCSDDYEAEINPMRCANESCSEAIPTDARALLPCRKCGAKSAEDRLLQAIKAYADFVKRFTDTCDLNAQISKSHKALARREAPLGLLRQLDTHELIHADNFLRYCCLYVLGGTYYKIATNIVPDSASCFAYREAWKHLKPLTELMGKFECKYDQKVLRILKDAGVAAMYSATAQLEEAVAVFKGPRTKESLPKSKGVRDASAVMEQGPRLLAIMAERHVSLYGRSVPPVKPGRDRKSNRNHARTAKGGRVK